MALSKDVNFFVNGGIEVKVEKAYLQVSKISGSKDKIEFFVESKKSKDTTTFKTEVHDFQPSLDGKNFIAQAYEHLKTLPEYAGATDC
jgi:hypothetical protein